MGHWTAPENRRWSEVLPDEAVAIQLFRLDGSDTGKTYEAMTFGMTRDGIGQFLRQQLIGPEQTRDGGYDGQIDILNENGDLLGEIPISDGVLFQRMRRKLKCRVLDPATGLPRARARASSAPCQQTFRTPSTEASNE